MNNKVSGHERENKSVCQTKGPFNVSVKLKVTGEREIRGQNGWMNKI